MNITNFLLPVLNNVLRYNEGSRSKLSSYNGKTFIINIIGFSFNGAVDDNGFILSDTEIINATNKEFFNNQNTTDTDTIDKSLDEENQNNDGYNVIITIPFDIINYVIDRDKLKAYRQIEFSGDTVFGRDLLEILSNLDFSIIYAKLSPVNGMILNQVAKVFTAIKEQFILMHKNLATSISEYLMYETKDIVNKHEIEEFCDEVDVLKARTELLVKRISIT